MKMKCAVALMMERLDVVMSCNGGVGKSQCDQFIIISNTDIYYRVLIVFGIIVMPVAVGLAVGCTYYWCYKHCDKARYVQ